MSAIPDQIKEYSVLRDQNPTDPRYAPLLSRFAELHACAPKYIPHLVSLSQMARSFWVCTPIDQTRCSADQEAKLELWRLYHENEFPSAVLEQISIFQARCLEVARSHFGDLVEVYAAEQRQIQQEIQLLSQQHSSRLINSIPSSTFLDVVTKSKVYWGNSRFPNSHYNSVSDSFHHTLGFTLSRLYAEPRAKFSVNDSAHLSITRMLNDQTFRLNAPYLRYLRCANARVVVVRWEVSAPNDRGDAWLMGVDMTEAVSSSHVDVTVPGYKMAKQWLHGIRNASFEQQALTISRDLKDLQLKISDPKYGERFAEISEAISVLLYTVRSNMAQMNSVIQHDVAVQSMKLHDFLNGLCSTPHHFAVAEHRPELPIRFTLWKNSKKINISDVPNVEIRCETSNIQAFIDNFVSNAVRYVPLYLKLYVRFNK